jgi:hypothetical protein
MYTNVMIYMLVRLKGLEFASHSVHSLHLPSVPLIFMQIYIGDHNHSSLLTKLSKGKRYVHTRMED